MTKWTVYARDLGKDVDAGAKPKYVDVGSLPISIVVDLDDDMIKQVGKDPLLQQQLQDAAVDAANDLKKDCIEDVKWADKMFGKSVEEFNDGKLSVNGLSADKVQFVKLKETLITKHIGEFDKTAEKAVLAAYDKWLKDKKEFRGFKIKLAINIAGNTLKLALNTAVIAMSGAAAPLAWVVFGYSAFSTLNKIWGDISKNMKDFDSMAKSVGESAKTLRESYAKMIDLGEANKLSAKELGKGLVKTVLGNIPGMDKYLEPITKSAKSILKDVGFLDQKLRGMEDDCHTTAQELGKLLKQMDTSTLPEELKADSKKFEDLVDKQITDIIKLRDSIGRNQKKIDAIETALKPIAELKQNWATGLELIFEFAKDDLPSAMGMSKIIDGVVEGIDKGVDLIVAIKKGNDRVNDTARLKKLAQA